MTSSTEHPTFTILYVEDSPTNQELMRSIIAKRPSVRLVIAATGRDAIEAAAEEQPALIMLDGYLPDMTGDEILQILRARTETAAVPVLFVSGDTATPRANENELGVIGHLIKPIDVRVLLSYVDELLGSLFIPIPPPKPS